MEVLGAGKHEPYPKGSYYAFVDGEEIVIPYRVYFPECHPGDFTRISSPQMAVLSAIMTRHHSGYQRELWAAQLCRYPEDWSVPFIGYLLGDYVAEVLRAIETGLSPEWETLFASFSPERQQTRRQLNHRIINYWNLYYRSRHVFRRLTEYPGYIIAKRLGLWDSRTAPRLTKIRKTDSTK